MTAGGSALPASYPEASRDDSVAHGSTRPADIESALSGQIQDVLAAGNDQAARDLFGADRRAAAAPRVAYRLALPARRRRSGRSGAGRLRQGLHPHRFVPAPAVVRGLVYADPDQRLPRSSESADAAVAMAAAGHRRRPARSAHHRARDQYARTLPGSAAAWRANGASSSWLRSASCPIGSASSSCSATMRSIRRARSQK